MRGSSRDSSPASRDSQDSSLGRVSFESVEEDGTEIAQSFVHSHGNTSQAYDEQQQKNGDSIGSNHNANNSKRNNGTKPHVHAPHAPAECSFCCPCGGFLGWKHIPLGGRRQSKSFSDLRLLGSSHSRGWAWDIEQDSDQVETPTPQTQKQVRVQEQNQQQTQQKQHQSDKLIDGPKQTDQKEERSRAALEMMPPEILDQIISLLSIDIPPNGYTPRNVDLISCLLTSRTLHSATLGVLYRHITIPHSIIFSKALAHIRQYPSLGTIVRRLDFAHFSSVGLGRTQRMNVDIQNLTARTLLECLDLLPNLKELLLQEHVEDDIDAAVLQKVFTGIPTLRALDFCGCSSPSFRTAFSSVVTADNPNLPPAYTRLKRLSLHECSSLPDDAIHVLLPRLVQLTHLDVSHTQITSRTLWSLSRGATLTHLNISRCTKLTGPEVVEFVTNHPAVTDSLIYLNLMVDVSRHRMLEEADVDALLPELSSTLRSLNLGGAKISSRHMPHLIRLSKHLDELGLASADLTLDDLNTFFRPPPTRQSLNNDKTSPDDSADTNWEPPQLRYLDLTKNPYVTPGTLANAKTCLLATPQSYPLDVMELSEKTISALRQRSRNGWVVRELGRRAWYVREPAVDPTDDNDIGTTAHDDGRRAWKMGARWWGMRKIPMSVGDVGGIYGHYMFKK